MAKIFKILGRLTGISFEWILIFFIAFAFLIRTSYIQTYLAQKIASYLSKELNTTIKIDKVSIIFFDRVALDGVLILDQKADTLLAVNTVYANIDDYNLKENYFHISRMELDKGVSHINKSKKDGQFNFQFLIDYFKSEEPKPESPPIKLQLDVLALNELSVHYDDNQIEPLNYGLDYAHLDFNKMKVEVSGYSLNDNAFSLQLKNFSAIEKCGLQISNLTSHISVSPKGIQLDETTIKTPLSEIYSPKFHLNTKTFDDFKHFEDSVTFDAILNESSVSCKDVSYFVPTLEGMDQKIKINVELKKNLKKLAINNLHVETGEVTEIEGSFNLPDFENLENSVRQQKIEFAYLSVEDLKKIKLPKTSKASYFETNELLEKLSFLKLENFSFTGTTKAFNVKSDLIRTAQGSAIIKDGLSIANEKELGEVTFSPNNPNNPMLELQQVNLKELTGSASLGILDGWITLKGKTFKDGNVDLENISGNIKRLDLLSYAYQNIAIENSKFIGQIFSGRININDPNLKLTYSGKVDLKKEKLANCKINIEKAELHALHFTNTINSALSANLTINTTSFDPKKITGKIESQNFTYKEGSKSFKDDSLSLEVEDIKVGKSYVLKSTLANINLNGNVNFNTIGSDLIAQFNKVFPSDVTGLSHATKSNSTYINNFKYTITLKKINDFLGIFVPSLKITGATNISGNYDGITEEFKMKLLSDSLLYNDISFQRLNCEQNLFAQTVLADYKVEKLSVSDSLDFYDVHFNTNGQQRDLVSYLTWDTLTSNESYISWDTHLVGKSKLNFRLKPSYLAINNQRWDIKNESEIGVEVDKLIISNFYLERGKQLISLKGTLSKNVDDELIYRLRDVDLNDLGKLSGAPVELGGTINGWGSLSQFYTNLTYTGDLFLDKLFIDGKEIGNIYVESNWNKIRQSLNLDGDLTYRNINTFHFEGDYFTERTTDNLEFTFDFNKTDIKFANAFIDSTGISDLKGFISGKLDLKGTPKEPIIDGQLALSSGNAKIDMLGVSVGMEGLITANKNGFFIKHMNLSDELNGKGVMSAKVEHNYFSNWRYQMDIELAPAIFSLIPGASDRFLIMNTNYKEGDLYYGTAFVTGKATISSKGPRNIIQADLTTKKGSSIYFPMYGRADIEEDQSFLIFGKNLVKTISYLEDISKSKESSLEMDLDFNITPEAKMKIIFNDQTDDEINASGNGDISLKINTLGDLTMNGTYTIKEGKYNFAMGPVIKQEFVIEEGGTIAWKGNPIGATLDVKTRIDVTANIAELAPEELSGGGNVNKQKVNCYLLLSDLLIKPRIDFDIKLPKGNETGKALIGRITSDPTELNRQFISLLVWKRFQPLIGTAAGGSSAAYDLVSNQLNSLLSQISNDYRMGVNLDKDEITKESTYEFGLSKGFLDNRLIVSGSFGVESNTNGSNNQNALIGDVNIEYLLSESGNVRVNVFNESNDNSIIQDKNLGLFTQGAGLSYQEEFDHFDNFKLAQYFLDVFRKKGRKKYPIKKKRQQTPVPKQSNTPIGKYFILNEENIGS